MSDLAVVLLSYNGGDDVITTLRSVIAESPSEIVVVDNGSVDGTADRVEQLGGVKVIRNTMNRGFSVAANQAIRATSAPFVFLLNQDAVVKPGALASLQSTLASHPHAAVVGSRVLNPDGTLQPTRRRFPSFGAAVMHGIVGIFRPNNPGTRSYTMPDEMHDAPARVDWVAMTATAVRRDAFDAVGGFDERYFFFVEDVDLCRRLTDAGYEIWFDPGAEVVHEWGGSWSKKPLKFIWLHQWNLFTYVRTHYRGAWILAWPFIAAGLLVRFTLLALRWLITKRSVPEHRSAGGAG